MSSTCAITGTILKLDGQPAAGQQVLFFARSTADDQGGQLATYTVDPPSDLPTIAVGVVSDVVTVFTDANGNFEVELLRGACVTIEIPGINLRKEMTVPDEDEAEFADLI